MADAPALERSPAKGSGAEVTIERSADHHYYADAAVNGHSVHFMVDTGAGETALTEADAKAIGLQIDPSQYEVIGDGASGMVAANMSSSRASTSTASASRTPRP